MFFWFPCLPFTRYHVNGGERFQKKLHLCQGPKQRPKFFLDFLGAVHGLGDLLSKQFAVTLSQAVHQRFECVLRHFEAVGQFSVRDRASLARQAELEFVEQRAFAVTDVFISETVEGAAEQGQGPGAIVESFRGVRVGGFNLEAGFGARHIERNDLSFAAFLRSCALPFIGQEPVQALEQERAKASTFPGDAGKRFLPQQSCEKRLGKVLSILRIPAPSADISVEWIPIRVSQMAKRLLDAGRLAGADCQNDGPMSSRKHRSVGIRGIARKATLFHSSTLSQPWNGKQQKEMVRRLSVIIPGFP